MRNSKCLLTSLVSDKAGSGIQERWFQSTNSAMGLRINYSYTQEVGRLPGEDNLFS